MECACCNIDKQSFPDSENGSCQLCNKVIESDYFKLCIGCSFTTNTCHICCKNFKNVDFETYNNNLRILRYNKIKDLVISIEEKKKLTFDKSIFDDKINNERINDLIKIIDTNINLVECGKVNFIDQS